MGRNGFSHVPLFRGFPGITPRVLSMLKKTPFFHILHFPAHRLTPMLSNSLSILDTVKSILLHSGFMNSTSICLFFQAQQLGNRRQERVKKQLFDLHLASLSFISGSLILALERSVKVNPPLHGCSCISPQSSLFPDEEFCIAHSCSQFKISILVLSKILIRD